MTTQPTLDLLRRNFHEVAERGANLYRAVKRHGDRRLGIFYFDLSDRITQPNFDLGRYAHENIATDFYQNEGSMQWNFYLYFVLESQIYEKISPDLITLVETDKTYARKFVRDEGVLASELSDRLKDLLQATRPPEDLSAVWTTRLVDGGLGPVADPDAPYKASVDDILAGRVQVPLERPTPQPVPAGTFIESLTLQRYRPFPLVREFSPGRVNLVRGVNGTGKTSFLEAIELAVCGGNRRQDGQRPQDVRLKIQYMGRGAPEYAPHSTGATYRARDLAWYGSYERGKNNLCHNFARFNFFDSDAAFRLSSPEDPREMLTALDSLLLGERATTIEERMRQFHDRLFQHEKSLGKERKLLNDEHAKTVEHLRALTKIKDTRESLMSELKRSSSTTGWRMVPAGVTSKELIQFQEAVESTADRIANCLVEVPWVPRLTVETLSQYVRKVERGAEAYTTQMNRLQLLRDGREKLDREKKAAERKQLLLARVMAYHTEPGAVETFESAATSLGDAKRTLASLKEAAGNLKGVDLAQYQHVEDTVPALQEASDADLRKSRRAMAKLQPQIATLKEQIGAISSVVQEIKSLGQRYCELTPHRNECPLCGQRHVSLAEQIERSQSVSVREKELQELATKLKQAETEMRRCANRDIALRGLRDALALVEGEDKVLSRSARSLIPALLEIDERQALARSRVDSVNAAVKRLRIGGYSEDEWNELTLELSEEFETPRSKLRKLDQVKTLLSAEELHLEKLKIAEKKDEGARREAEQEIRKLVQQIDPEIRVENAETEFSNRVGAANEVLQILSDIKKLVKFEDSDELATLRSSLAMLANSIGRVQAAAKRLEERGELEERLLASKKRTEAGLASNAPQYERASHAVALLSDLLGAGYKAKFTAQVVKDHREKLSAIFSLMHSPKEFSGVHFEPEFLLERHSGDRSRIAEISTGQRAALALSIFLSLNSTVADKAPWLIFDDPVVHVDDLNTLSFFDMLRDLVLLGNRQVFFATANHRVADIFTRKFDCLGNEFQPIALTRPSA